MVGGGIWPVVHRELRAGARRPFNHWLRVAGAFGGIIIFAVSASNTPITIVGGQIFLGVHRLFVLMILCILPAITADCIARERREGTLGLLFLTPLRSWEIVIGKVAVQALKAATLWLAVVPVLTIPFLTGGVSWRMLAGYLGAELCVGIFCLAAGILATSLTDKRSMAFVLAFAFAAVLVFGLTEVRWWELLPFRQKPATGVWLINSVQVTPGRSVRAGNAVFFFKGAVALRTPAPPVVSLLPLAGRLVFALLVLWGAIRFAGFCVERSWKDKIPSFRRANWEKFCGEPLFQRRFKGQMRRTLEWNPIAWLQQYSWRSRLTKWGLCLAFTVLICMASGAGTFGGIGDSESVVFGILAAAYTYAGINGFLQEKKTGALELILVTPLTVNEIVFGRVWGLWKQFFPAALTLAACHYAIRLLDPMWHSDMRYDIDYLEFAALAGFFALPFYATLAALYFRNIVVAAAFTWLTLLAASLAGFLFGPIGVLAAHAAFVLFAFQNLRDRLAQRDYSF